MYARPVARAAKYDDDMILDAMAAETARAGLDAASVASVAKRLGAPSGSVYHRFPTRNHLIGALWIRTIRSFHDAIERALDPLDGADLASRVVTAVFEWIDADRVGSILLLKFRTEDLIEKEWPTEVRLDIAAENQRIADMVNRVADARRINPLDAVLGLVDIPAAAARRATVFDNDVVTDALRVRTASLCALLLNPAP